MYHLKNLREPFYNLPEIGLVCESICHILNEPFMDSGGATELAAISQKVSSLLTKYGKPTSPVCDAGHTAFQLQDLIELLEAKGLVTPLQIEQEARKFEHKYPPIPKAMR